MYLDLNLTLIGLVVFAALTILSGFMGAKPPDLSREHPRLMPWRFIMLLSATVTIVFLVHLLTLLGLKTDPPPRY